MLEGNRDSDTASHDKNIAKGIILPTIIADLTILTSSLRYVQITPTRSWYTRLRKMMGNADVKAAQLLGLDEVSTNNVTSDGDPAVS
jgi:hypothetical protein